MQCPLDGPPKCREHQLANFARGSNPAYHESKIPQPKTQQRTKQPQTEATQNGTRNLNLTTQSQATKGNKKEPDQCDTRKLKAEKETVTNNGSNNTATAPLTMEIMTSPGGYEPFKMKGKMEANTSFDVFDDRGSSRADIAKAKSHSEHAR